MNPDWKLKLREMFGGPGSGNFDHAGRPGEVGGSDSNGGFGPLNKLEDGVHFNDDGDVLVRSGDAATFFINADAIWVNEDLTPSRSRSYDYAVKYNAFACGKVVVDKIDNFASRCKAEGLTPLVAIGVTRGDPSSALDKNPTFYKAMEQAIADVPGIERLRKVMADAYEKKDNPTITVPKDLHIKDFKGNDLAGTKIKLAKPDRGALSQPIEQERKWSTTKMLFKAMGGNKSAKARELVSPIYEQVRGKIVGVGDYKRRVPNDEPHPGRHGNYTDIFEFGKYVKLKTPVDTYSFTKEIGKFKGITKNFPGQIAMYAQRGLITSFPAEGRLKGGPVMKSIIDEWENGESAYDPNYRVYARIERL